MSVSHDVGANPVSLPLERMITYERLPDIPPFDMYILTQDTMPTLICRGIMNLPDETSAAMLLIQLTLKEVVDKRSQLSAPTHIFVQNVRINSS